MKFLIVLLISSFSLLNFQENFTIFSTEELVKVTINNGLYFTIRRLKNEINNNVAIETCSQFYSNNNCERMVTTYMGKTLLIHSPNKKKEICFQ